MAITFVAANPNLFKMHKGGPCLTVGQDRFVQNSWELVFSVSQFRQQGPIGFEFEHVLDGSKGQGLMAFQAWRKY